MKGLLYCIKHEKTVKAYHSVAIGLSHLHTVRINNSPDPGTRYDVDECDFPQGWATVPPPDFDMDLFMETAEPELVVDIVGYDYDVERDEIITEIVP